MSAETREIGKSDMVRDWRREEDCVPSASLTIEKAWCQIDVAADKKQAPVLFLPACGEVGLEPSFQEMVSPLPII